MYDNMLETVEYLTRTANSHAKIGIILGSGLGGLVGEMEEKLEVDYMDIPNFPVSTVEGHEGKLVFGKIGGVEIIAMQGRFHFYEGYSMQEIVYPIYVMRQLGLEKLIISNAAGGINREFKAGTLMIIEDHINMFGTNPLIGRNDERFGPRFPDMTEVYKRSLIDIARKTAAELGIDYEHGIYVGTTGPSYETAAEIRAFSVLGADAVGMSTVPEAIVANYLGIDVLGISCITNMATGLADTTHSHEKVVKTAKKVEEKFCNWVESIVKKLGE